MTNLIGKRPKASEFQDTEGDVNNRPRHPPATMTCVRCSSTARSNPAAVNLRIPIA